MEKDNNQGRALNKKDYEFFCGWMGGDGIKTEELRVKAFWQFRDHLINMLLDEIYDVCVNGYKEDKESYFVDKEVNEPGEPICTLYADFNIGKYTNHELSLKITDACIEFDYEGAYHKLAPTPEEIEDMVKGTEYELYK